MTRPTNSRHLTPAALRGLRWRGLVRESTEAQAEKWSPERQRDDLRRAAAEIGLIPVHPEFYERVGSGEEVGASELAQALEDGKAGQYDVLLVLHTSRFARNRTEATRMKEAFRRAGVVIYFTAQRLISGSYTGALTEGISEVIDEHENEQRRFWIAGGQRQRQMSGRWVGVIPFGYRKALVDFADGTRGWDGGLEPDPETAPTVRAMFDAAAAGAGGRAQAVDLNARGIRTATGALWMPRQVVMTLQNPIYAGRLIRYRRAHATHYYDEGSEDGRADLGTPFPAIVEPALFDQVQEAMELRRRHEGAPRNDRSYPLSTVIRCRACGHKMTGMYRDDRRYYRCAGRVVYGVCEAPSIRADRAEGEFAEWLSSAWRLPADWRAEIARTTVSEARAGERDRQKQLAATLERLKKMYQWGDIEEAEYRAQASELRGQMAVMAKPSIGGLEAVADALLNVGPAWSIADPEVREAIPPLMLKTIEVEQGEIAAWVVRAELRPLLDLCVPADTRQYPRVAEYTVRFSA
jgi:DNA invertase Pin-like site-specific DNA recombinase